MVAGPRRHRFRVGRQQRDDEGPTVADQHRVLHQRRLLERALHRLRGDVLAAGGDDQVLLAVGDEDEPVTVDGADVPGVEEALVIEDLGGGPGLFQ